MQRDRCPPGASYVEVAISLPLFILILLFIIDIARYATTITLLNYAAYAALDYATKVPVEIEYREVECNFDEDRKDRCKRYYDILQTLFSRALSISSLIASTSDVPSGIQLSRFRHYDGTIYDRDGGEVPDKRNIDADVAFLRPGERVKRLSDDREIDHPTRKLGRSPGQGWPRAGENWMNILDGNPLEVRVEADFQPITPFLPTWHIEAVQHGYRQTRPYGTGVPPPGGACLQLEKCDNAQYTTYDQCRKCIARKSCSDCATHPECKAICETYVSGGCNHNPGCSDNLCFQLPPAGLGCDDGGNHPTPTPTQTPLKTPPPPPPTPTPPPDCEANCNSEFACALNQFCQTECQGYCGREG